MSGRSWPASLSIPCNFCTSACTCFAPKRSVCTPFPHTEGRRTLDVAFHDNDISAALTHMVSDYGPRNDKSIPNMIVSDQDFNIRVHVEAVEADNKVLGNRIGPVRMSVVLIDIPGQFPVEFHLSTPSRRQASTACMWGSRTRRISYFRWPWAQGAENGRDFFFS